MCGFFGGFVLAVIVLLAFSGALSSLESLSLASVVWYLVFYSPGDIFLALVDFFPVKIILVLLKEIFRAKKISMGKFDQKQREHTWYRLSAIFVVGNATYNSLCLSIGRLVLY